MITEIIALLLVYPLWTLIHEGTHALVAKRCGATLLAFRPYPNWALGRFTWGSISWAPPPNFPASSYALVSFSPRIPALIAVILCPIVAHFGPTWLVIMVAGGVIDQVVNSLGISASSDLKKWCRQWGHRPWAWRVFGLAPAAASTALTLLAIL